MNTRPRGGARDSGAARRQTIQRIIEREQTKTGRTPSAEEIARTLACSVARVRMHLSKITSITPNQGDVSCSKQPRLL